MTVSSATGSGSAPPPKPGWVAPPGAGELVVAVDTASLDEAMRLRDTLADAASFYKVGKELFTAAGPRAVSEFASVGRVFLDLKFHDIPATVAGAVRASAGLGASIVDVHASGGKPMLEAAVRAAWSTPAPPLLLGVTVLTHFDRESAAEVYPGISIADQVLNLARLTRAAGLGGVVASASEAEKLRSTFGDDFVLLVPGVRPRWAAEAHDQRRVATPGEAARRGANYIVVGRAITRHADPRTAALRIVEEIRG